MRTQTSEPTEISFGTNTPKRDGLGGQEGEWIAAAYGSQWGLLDAIILPAQYNQNLFLIITKQSVRKWH